MRVLPVFFAVAVLATALPASAQCEPEPDVSDQTRAAARQHYTAGIEASSAQRWPEARVAFQRAYDLAPLTPVVYNLATAQAQMGSLVEAAEGYRRFLRRCRSQDTPELRADAQQLLGDLTGRIGRITLRIQGLTSADRIELNGTELPAAILGTAVPVSPGAQNLRVLRGGQEVLARRVDMAPGAAQTVELTLPTLEAAPGGGAVSSGGATTTSSGGDFDWGVFLGVTGAIVVAGAIAAIVAAVLLGGAPAGQAYPDATWSVQVPLVTF